MQLCIDIDLSLRDSKISAKTTLNYFCFYKTRFLHRNLQQFSLYMHCVSFFVYEIPSGIHSILYLYIYMYIWQPLIAQSRLNNKMTGCLSTYMWLVSTITITLLAALFLSSTRKIHMLFLTHCFWPPTGWGEVCWNIWLRLLIKCVSYWLNNFLEKLIGP